MPRGNYERMHEKHGDPRRRPSVDLLITKLRKLSNLQDHPDAVYEVIHDLMYTYFVQREKRPWELHRLIGAAMLELQMVMGTKLEDATLPPEREIITGEWGTPPITKLPNAKNVTPAPSLDSGAGFEDEGWNTNSLKEYLKPQRAGTEKLIADHMPRYIGGMRIRCKCDRFFEDEPEWAHHLRVRIWRYLLNEFRPDAES